MVCSNNIYIERDRQTDREQAQKPASINGERYVVCEIDREREREREREKKRVRERENGLECLNTWKNFKLDLPFIT